MPWDTMVRRVRSQFRFATPLVSWSTFGGTSSILLTEDGRYGLFEDMVSRYSGPSISWSPITWSCAKENGMLSPPFRPGSPPSLELLRRRYGILSGPNYSQERLSICATTGTTPG